jgi:hypothetical protein
VRHGCFRNTAARAARIKLLRFDGSTYWAMFRRQFHSICQGRTTGHPKGKSCAYSFCRGKLPTFYTASIQKQFIEALECCFWDHQLAVAYHYQLKARTELITEFLEEFAATIEHLTLRALVGLPQYIQREAAYAFFNRIRDPELKFPLLVSGERTLDKAICQALRLVAVKAVAITPSRLHMVRAGVTVTRD